MRSGFVDSQYRDRASNELWSGALLSGYQIRDCFRNAFAPPDRMHLPVRPVEDVVDACVLSQLQESKFGAFCAWAIRSRGGAPKSHHQDMQDLVSANASEEDIRISHFSRNSTLNGAFSEMLIPGVYKPLQPLSSPREGHHTIERRARAAGIWTRIGNHSFRATGITEYLKNGGKLEIAQQMANHESSRTTGLYDRRDDQVSLDEIERIVI